MVQKLMKMMRFRNTHPAFQGELTVQDTPDRQLVLTRRQGPHWARLQADVETYDFQIRYSAGDGEDTLL